MIFYLYISGRYKYMPDSFGGLLPMDGFHVGEILPIDPICSHRNILWPPDKLLLFDILATDIQLLHFFIQSPARDVEFIHDRFDIAVMADQGITNYVLLEMAELIGQ